MRSLGVRSVLVSSLVMLGLCAILLQQATVAVASGSAEQQVSASALVRLGGDTFLVVSDRKYPNDPGPRLTVLAVQQEGVSCDLLPLTGLGGADEPSDLEAACAVAGRDEEYLLAESGYYEGRFGRVMHVRIAQRGGQWTATVLGTLVPFGKPTPRYSTPGEDQVEGMACLRTGDGKLVLVLARRGGASKPAALVWGTLENLGGRRPLFVQSGEAALTSGPAPLGDRGAADLYLKAAGPNKWRVWAVAAIDAGNHGPFRSLIYDAGKLVWGKSLRLHFKREPVKALWSLEGLKVEALADPPSVASESVVSVGTDDELYGGIWRPLFRHRTP